MIVAGIFVPAAVAAELDAAVRLGALERVRQDGVEFSDEAKAIVGEFDSCAAAIARRSEVAADVCTSGAENLHPATMEEAESAGPPVVGPAEAAKLAGVTRQAINDRCLGESLPASKDDRGHWRIRVDDLARVYEININSEETPL